MEEKWNQLLEQLQSLNPTFEIMSDLKLAVLSQRLPEVNIEALEEEELDTVKLWLDNFSEGPLEEFKTFYNNLSHERWMSLSQLSRNQKHFKTLRNYALVARALWVIRPELLKKRHHRRNSDARP